MVTLKSGTNSWGRRKYTSVSSPIHGEAIAPSALLVVPRHRLSTYGCRAFAVAGPTAWNSFLDNLRDPDITMDNF